MFCFHYYSCDQCTVVDHCQSLLSGLPMVLTKDSLVADKSSISELLNMAYANHEITSDRIKEVRLPIYVMMKIYMPLRVCRIRHLIGCWKSKTDERRFPMFNVNLYSEKNNL